MYVNALENEGLFQKEQLIYTAVKLGATIAIGINTNYTSAVIHLTFIRNVHLLFSAKDRLVTQTL
jgi:hypothetical protein